MFNFTALNPGFLSLLPLAAVPILFHLFFRVRKRTQTFSSFLFLHAVDPRLSARRKLREWLTLLLRALALLALLLALARPVWQGAGRHGNVAAVLLIDNSGSMAAPGPDRRPRLDAALEAAGVVVAELGPHDRAGIVLLVDDPPRALPPGLTSDRKDLRAALDRVTGTEASGLPGRALARAADLLRAAPAAHREIHVFTDLQRGEWDTAAATAPDLPPGTSVLIHRVEPARGALPNVAIAGIDLPPRRLVAGRTAQAGVLLFNPTPSDVAVRLNTADDQQGRATREVTVPAGATRTVAVALPLALPGFHWLRAQVEGDRFAADNTACVGLDVRDKAGVLFAGAWSDFGLMPAALAPTRDGRLSGLVTALAPPAEASAVLETSRPVLAVTAWDTLSAPSAAGLAEALKQYVEGGGVLMVLPRPEGRSPAAGAPAWIGATPGAEAGRPEGDAVVVFDRAAHIWDDLRDEKGEVLLRQAKAMRYRPLAPGAGSVALLGLEDGRPLLTRAACGRGAVFACGLAADTRWSNLPLKPGWLAALHGIALGQPAATSDVATAIAGAPLAMADRASSVALRAVEGEPLEWKGPARDLPVLARAGVYTLETAGAVRHVAVRASDREGLMQFVSADRVPALGPLAHAVLSYRGSAALRAGLRRARTGVDLFVPLLGLACLAVLVEGWLVNPVPRQARR